MQSAQLIGAADEKEARAVLEIDHEERIVSERARRVGEEATP